MTPRDAPRSQFEQRMRLRRAATCVSAARVAIEAGRLVEAEDRLEEACRLDPDSLEATLLLEQLRSAEPRAAAPPVLFGEERGPAGPGRWSHWVAILIAVVSLAALAWWRAPGSNETRFTPARPPEPQRQSRPEPPAVAQGVPAPTPVLPQGAVPAEDLFATGIGLVPSAASPSRAADERPERGTTGESPALPSPPPSRAPATPAPPTFAAPAGASDDPARPVPSATNAAPLPPAPEATVPGLLEERARPEPASPEPAVPPPAVTSPPPATSDAAPASLRDGAADDEAAIGQVLGDYVDAYNRLDATAASRVWPTVDQRALARAFAGLESQGLTFEGCELSVDGAEATAACRGRARYVPKVGDRDPISQARRWTFRLHRATAGWVIVQAEAR